MVVLAVEKSFAAHLTPTRAAELRQRLKSLARSSGSHGAEIAAIRASLLHLKDYHSIVMEALKSGEHPSPGPRPKLPASAATLSYNRMRELSTAYSSLLTAPKGREKEKFVIYHSLVAGRDYHAVLFGGKK